jgi:hypothetical protein
LNGPRFKEDEEETFVRKEECKIYDLEIFDLRAKI